jgi:hypothetical protein
MTSRLGPTSLGESDPVAFTVGMFVGAETVVNAPFTEARPGLVAVADGGWLENASGDAYGEWGAGLARVGPLGSVRAMSRLVDVRFSELSARAMSATLILRWEAAGPGGGLFPVLDADLTIAPYGESASLLALAGAYRPPLGAVGATLDRVVLRRVANATIQGFVNQIGDAIVKLPAKAPSAEQQAVQELPAKERAVNVTRCP